ncbi:MAG: UDP-N-acetyl-alpha-D-muramoyl-L-alanyl-L-glutamate epimerase, partial [Solirubrobacteraceae bacterium]|nr:UDP-N-acetyl-alpha-D-muramoyl-L-alanyl-L-glutamate epimerase [Solirubrobacteraceae bacterium]
GLGWDPVSAKPQPGPVAFAPASFETFRFVHRDLDHRGTVRLGYALDRDVEFVEEIDLPAGTRVDPAARERVDGILALLHWVAGVSYYKTAAPARVSSDTGAPPPAAARLLEALYSEGLGEFALVNGLPGLPRPRFAPGPDAGGTPAGDDGAGPGGAAAAEPRRVLVPIGGGKDSVVALEAVRRSGCEVALFSVGDPPAIAGTARVAGLPHLVARRRLDPGLAGLNRSGALNGHIPITAIVACVAVLTAALHDFDAVAMANERSASHGNVRWEGVEVNHQFSKGFPAERLLRAAVAEAVDGVDVFSVLRPASELAIARAFARLEPYHGVFTSCNAIFRLDPARRASSWCGDCPKCRFVFLVLAPFMVPADLAGVFGRDLLDDEDQFPGFALLTATGGYKPFECVGEEEESLAAIRMLAGDPRWARHSVVRRLAAEVIPRFPPGAGAPDAALALSEDHAVPASLLPHVRALLGA